MSSIKNSSDVLPMNEETFASLDNSPSLPPKDGLTRRDEANESGNSRSNRRNLLCECLSSNAFKSNREKNHELTEQLQQQEHEVDSSHSSKWDNTSSKVPYAQIGGPQSPSLPPPHFFRERHQRQEQQNTRPTLEASRRHPWNHSDSSLHPNPNPYNHTTNNNNNDNNNNTSGSNELPTPTREDVEICSFRLTEFKTEFKSLFVDLVEYGKAKTWKKKILTVFLCVISMVVFYDLLFGRQDYIITWLHSFIIWMTTHHTAAVFAFVGIFVVSTLAFVPPTLLVFGAGYAFTMAMDSVLAGVTAAAISCFLGSCIGAIIAFLRSRYMMRDLVKLFAARYPLVKKIDQALKLNHGFWIMLLLRLCPIIPFNGLNYCCGITGVTLHDFTLSLVGVLPFQIYTIILGATASAIEVQNLENDDYAKTERLAFIGFIIAGVIFSLVAIVYAWRLVKQELRRELSLSVEDFECVARSDKGPSSFPVHLQEGDASMHDSAEIMSETNEESTAFQEEGEEWFWIWA